MLFSVNYEPYAMTKFKIKTHREDVLNTDIIDIDTEHISIRFSFRPLYQWRMFGFKIWKSNNHFALQTPYFSIAIKHYE